MASYTYVAYEDSGRRLNGTIEAADADAAASSLAAQGVHLLELTERREVGGASGRTKKKVSRADLALFTRRLADLAAAGLPLDRALRVAGEHADNETLAEITEGALQDVHAGLPISEALGKHPKLFPPVFTMTLRAGEASGQFAQVARRLADFQQLEIRRRSQITAALVYPTILACSAVGVIAFMVLFVVPKLSSVFNSLGDDLPITTKALLHTSDFIAAHWIQLFVGIAAVVVLTRAWLATDAGARARDRFILNAPILGKVASKAIASRYSRVLGTLVYGGVPILESLDIAGAAAGNRIFEEGGQHVQDQVREGRRIADAMRESEAFSSLMVQMVSVGEETGDLPTMLGRVSETLDFEVDNGVQKLTAMVEPFIVLFMGAFVGFVVLSILLPVYQAQELVK